MAALLNKQYLYMGMVNICTVAAAAFNPSSPPLSFVLPTYQRNNEARGGGSPVLSFVVLGRLQPLSLLSTSAGGSGRGYSW